MIQDILAAGRAAVRSSAAASSAAQEASIAAAAAAENANAALEEVEKLVNILGGHKCDQWMSFPSTKKNINGSTHIDKKTLADESKDESAMDASSDPFINCDDQKAKKSDAKDTVSVKEKVSQIFKQMFSRKETIIDGMEENRTVDSPRIRKTEHVGKNDESQGFASVDAANSIQAPHSVPEAETSLITIEEDGNSLKSIKTTEACPKGYSRDFLLSFQSHPLAMERPHSEDPLVLPEVNEMVSQMLKYFPKDFSKSHQGWIQGCPDPRTQECPVTSLIRQSMFNAAVVPEEPLQSCDVLGLLALKQEYEQMVPALLPFLSKPLMDSFKESLVSLGTVVSSTTFDNPDGASALAIGKLLVNIPGDHNKVNVLLHQNHQKMMTTMISVLKELPDHSSLRLQIKLLAQGHYRLTYSTKKVWLAVKDFTMKSILLCCSNITIQNEGQSIPCEEMRTLYVMKNTNSIRFQVENVRLDEEGNLTFQLIDGEGEDKEGVTYKLAQQSGFQPFINEDSKSDKCWSKMWATISVPEKESRSFLSLEEEKENVHPKVDPKRPIWAIPVLEEAGVETRAAIKVDPSLGWEPDDGENYLEDEDATLDDPILSSEGEVTTIVEVGDDKPVSDEFHNETNTPRFLQAIAVKPESSQSVVSEPQCQNCGKNWRHCLNGKPVIRLDAVPASIISCGPYWGEKKRGRVATVVNLLEAGKGQRVEVQWGSVGSKPGKTAKYFLTNSDPQAAAQAIFNFNCGNCSNCWCPKRSCRHGEALTNVETIPEVIVKGGGFKVEAVGSFWGVKKRGRKGKIVELCPEADAVMVVWDDESEPAKTIRYKLISNLSHAKDVHIFNLSCI